MAGPSASWSWFPAALEGLGPAVALVDDPFDPFDPSVSFNAATEAPFASLLDELDLSAVPDAPFEPLVVRPSADLDDPFAWRPVPTQADVGRVFTDAVDQSAFEPAVDVAELAEWTPAHTDSSTAFSSSDTIDDLTELGADAVVEFDLDELDNLGEFDPGDDSVDDDGDDPADDSDAQSDWFDR